jgi:F0F1-type ATP synthase membrane subunit c/vacuolar-type H+-ATPase subunit K
MISRLSLRTILIAGGVLVAVVSAIVLGITSARATESVVEQRALGRYQLLAKGLAGEYPG